MALNETDKKLTYSNLVSAKLSCNMRFPNTVLRSYPRLLDAESYLMSLYLQSFGKLYMGFAYDVPVGSGTDAGPRVPPNIRYDFLRLTMKRIDAVGFMYNLLDIIELKPRANMATIGQVLTYKELFPSTYNNYKPLRPVIVCHSIDDDVYNIAGNLKIMVYRFPNNQYLQDV